MVTPAAELGMTPDEEAAIRASDEGKKLLEPQVPGERDDKIYLPGERINEAQASQDVEVARDLKALRQQTPALDAQMTADEAHNSNIRSNAINSAIPDRVVIQRAEGDRQAAMEAAKPRVFNAGNAAADVQPIVDNIKEILNEPEIRQNTQAQQYIKPEIDRLIDENGNPKITDPRELWGWRQDIQHKTSSAATQADPNLSRVSGLLGRVLDTTDNAIEAAAPGYKAQIRDDYAARSKNIDAMVALDAERNKLFDSQNVPNYNAVQGLMRRIVKARNDNDPYEPFTNVSQDTLNQLWAVRDSMRRQRAADRLATPQGSPTTQNFGDVMRLAAKSVGRGLVPLAGMGVGHLLMPGGFGEVGGMLGSTAASETFNYLTAQRALQQRLLQGQRLLNVPGTPPPNPLAPP
jgi:hypothetical protein